MVYFRQVTEPHISEDDSQSHRYWHLEYYGETTSGGMCSPVGFAYVWEAFGVGAVQLQFILVADACRRQGIGTKLISAAKERWPELQATGPMGVEGEGLLRTTGLLEADDEY